MVGIDLFSSNSHAGSRNCVDLFIGFRYGWHFPELGKIVTDNISFVKTVNIIGTREKAIDSDLSDILPEEVEEKVKEAAEISMGTEISLDDIINIQHLCDQVSNTLFFVTIFVLQISTVEIKLHVKNNHGSMRLVIFIRMKFISIYTTLWLVIFLSA